MIVEKQMKQGVTNLLMEQELDYMKKRLKETEEEAAAFREMQAKVEKEMSANATQGFYIITDVLYFICNSVMLGPCLTEKLKTILNESQQQNSCSINYRSIAKFMYQYAGPIWLLPWILHYRLSTL
ncbi:hypothetical protein L2E82_20339 [Cichorium intybus]|uniref:Uncharacterized protein n=1 Tax=Cichorium intybus TaxID=13427 RepID=A0ACB9DSQ1_CICIN|nr:hypothetical protein L2E82_20339 [Cichorium intybus]